MKNILFVLIALFSLTFTSVNAQNKVYKKGGFNASAGIGLLPTYFADNAQVDVLPVNIRVGYNIADHFNVNLYTGYSASTSRAVKDFNGDMRTYENKFLMIGLRTELHAARTDKFDIYGGFMFGYNKSFVTETIFENGDFENPSDAPSNEPTTFKPASDKVLFSGFIGATYFVSPKLGIFGEVGYGVSLVNLGVSFKL
jgi:hypothetical protein